MSDVAIEAVSAPKTTVATKTGYVPPWRNPWRKPYFLSAITWAYVLWSIGADDAYFKVIRDCWGESLRNAFHALPDPSIPQLPTA